MTGPMPGLLDRLDRNDRLLFSRWTLGATHPAGARWAWMVVTHLGCAVVSIAVALAIPLAFLPDRRSAWLPGTALAISHFVVQVIKRLVQRERPSVAAVIASPDRFSFPSGHSASSLSVALGLGLLVPTAAPALVAVGMLVGWSRVVLGVHYPGDVLAGQVIAAATVLGCHLAS